MFGDLLLVNDGAVIAREEGGRGNLDFLSPPAGPGSGKSFPPRSS